MKRFKTKKLNDSKKKISLKIQKTSNGKLLNWGKNANWSNFACYFHLR